MNDKHHEFEKYDFFRSDRFVNDPYSYFDYLREQSPVLREPHQGIFMVTGYDEALEIYNDPDRLSSCMSTTGWIINPLSLTYWWLALVTVFPALLATILVFLDQQITAVIVNRSEHKLKVS